jgi:hypothetical protein
MAENEDTLSVTLPDALRRQFALVEHRLWRVESSVALCCVAGGWMASYLALFISDRFWNTPVWLRWTLCVCGWAVAVSAGAFWARRWVWKRRDLKALASLVQQRYGRLGDRLLGIVELANEERHNANFSPTLYHAAIHQVADEAKSCDFRQSVSTRGARKMAFGTAGLAVCLAAVFGVLPQAGWNAFQRWAFPARHLARFTLVTLGGLPAEIIVPHGEPFNITANVNYRSFWKPRRALALWPRQPAVEGAVDAGKVLLRLPGAVENADLVICVGDARAVVKIAPVHRPSLQDLAAQIQLPDYLHYPDQKQDLQNGSLLAIEGSRIAFRGKVSRGLASALIQNGGGDATPLKIEGDSFISSPSEPDGPTEYTFSWRDSLGLTNAAPLRLALQLRADAPPVPEIEDMPHEIALLNSDVLSLHVQARDDFGVRDFGLLWSMTEDSPPATSASTEVKMMTDSPHVKTAEKVFLWSPSMYGIPAGSVVELEGFARDFYPDRERIRTSPYHIRVLSPEEHAELVRAQLEAVLAQAEEITRLQEKIVAGIGEVNETPKMASDQKAARLGQNKEDQKQNAANLDDLTRQAERPVREAMKNPLLDGETIRQWSDSIRQWRKLSQEKMPAASEAMEKARQESGGQPQEIAEALKKAQDILQELEKMENKANQRLDNMQAMTLAQRLRKVGGVEKEIGTQLFDSASNTVGLLPRALPQKYKLLEGHLVLAQAAAQTDTAALQGEISRFFERTQKPDYGQVGREMKESRAADELDRLGGLIDNNIGIEASEDLGQWSARFDDWAARLEPKSSGQGTPKPGDSDPKNMDLTEQLIALLRLRENEMNLHEQTGILDQDKGSRENYVQKAGTLAGNQEKLAADMDAIHEKTPVPQLDPAFADTSQTMKDTLGILRKPETGKPAGDAEVKSIESITDLINLINEQGQQPRQQSSPQQNAERNEEMQFLMQLARMKAGGKQRGDQPNTRLTSPGGAATHAGDPLSGNATGKRAGDRAVHHAAGSIENAPDEFREALENYYHGLEKTKE